MVAPHAGVLHTSFLSYALPVVLTITAVVYHPGLSFSVSSHLHAESGHFPPLPFLSPSLVSLADCSVECSLPVTPFAGF